MYLLVCHNRVPRIRENRVTVGPYRVPNLAMLNALCDVSHTIRHVMKLHCIIAEPAICKKSKQRQFNIKNADTSMCATVAFLVYARFSVFRCSHNCRQEPRILCTEEKITIKACHPVICLYAHTRTRKPLLMFQLLQNQP